MRKPDVSLTGVVIQGDTKIAFVADGFRMTFVRVDYTTEYDNKPITIHPDENGYIWGRTDQRKAKKSVPQPARQNALRNGCK